MEVVLEHNVRIQYNVGYSKLDLVLRVWNYCTELNPGK